MKSHWPSWKFLVAGMIFGWLATELYFIKSRLISIDHQLELGTINVRVVAP